MGKTNLLKCVAGRSPTSTQWGRAFVGNILLSTGNGLHQHIRLSSHFPEERNTTKCGMKDLHTRADSAFGIYSIDFENVWINLWDTWRDIDCTHIVPLAIPSYFGNSINHTESGAKDDIILLINAIGTSYGVWFLWFCDEIVVWQSPR